MRRRIDLAAPVVLLVVAAAAVAFASGGVGGGGGINPGTAVRGDVIVGDSTPAWTRLGLGATGRVLGSDGTDAKFLAPGGDVTAAVVADNLTLTVNALQGNAVPAGATTNGQLLIGRTDTGAWAKAALTAGTNVTVTNGTGTITVATTAQPVDPSVNGFRLTLTTGTPVTTADVTAAQTIYLSPYTSTSIATKLGTGWAIATSSEISMVLSSMTADRNYDVFAYSDGGTLAFHTLQGWTSDTTRTATITREDGVWVLSGAVANRYVGTIRTTATNATEDSAAKRFVWNAQNRVTRFLSVVDATDNWSYTTDAWRQARATATNQLAVVVGLEGELIEVRATSTGLNDGTAAADVPAGVGVDSTTANSAQVYGSRPGVASSTTLMSSTASYVGYVPLGYHYFAWLERSVVTTGTTFWYGDNGTTVMQTGITGRILQ